MASVQDVANYLLYLRDNDMETGKYYALSNLKMQKLLYFCQGIYSAVHNGSRLIVDDEFEAWRYGPVLPSAYFRFNIYGQNDIPRNETGDFSGLSEGENLVIQNVWENLRYRSAFDLVEASHVQNGPWHNVYHGEGDNIINQEIIVNYFGGQN
ncbi:Panacea domain-containing protein [Sporosarcina ureilytica]|uniref:Antitoxin SocA-like Panacea domain-containing protein n=1 Tax=Sporosarcina ureilytica TaxID=298596 RepID=A0A1D8JFC9_9BACL|nr:type II toxin-antitoxin system antitoxin SocA domain-containing protein [Sporosarcina ureilytica]AOV07409.1 hypothetical protein BI350_07570 [Sporosarcina ureilytica]